MKPSQIAQNLRRIATRIEHSSNPSRSRVAASIHGILRHIVGSDWSFLTPLAPNKANSSQLLWHAMKELKMDDWAPDTNIDDVVEKMKELGAQVGVTNIGEALGYALENFNTYHEYYNPEAPPSGIPMDR